MTRLVTPVVAILLCAMQVFAQTQTTPPTSTTTRIKAKANMVDWMAQASQPLTKTDVAGFFKAVDAYLEWLGQDAKRRAMFATLPPPIRQDKLHELLGDNVGPMGNLLVLEGRVLFAESASKPNARPQMQAELKRVEAKMATTERELAGMSPDQQAQFKAHMTARLELMKAVANYPDASIALFKKHETKLMSAVRRLANESTQSKK